MIVALHQPDFLPYTGFWFKMIKADGFVLAVHDQFQKRGYQRRVAMRGTWASLQLVGQPVHVPISTISVQEGWQDRVIDAIRGRYSGATHWRSRGPDLLDRIATCQGTTLVEVNVSLIHVVRGLLQIDTPLLTTAPPVRAGIDRLIEQVHMVGGTGYLSGSGGSAYMGDNATERFAEAGLTLQWSPHRHLTSDSIVTVLMDYEDPMDAILNTSSPHP